MNEIREAITPEAPEAAGEFEHQDEHQEEAPAPAPAAPGASQTDAVALAFLKGKAAARSTPDGDKPAAPNKTNQGSVIALVAVAVCVLLVIVGFVVIMWRLSKSEGGLKTYILEQVDRLA